MATEVDPKDLDKIQKDNEKVAEQIAAAEAELAREQAQASLVASKEALQTENERLKARLAAVREQVKLQKASTSPSEQAATSGQRYEDIVKVDGDTPQEAAPAVDPEEKKAGN